VLGGAAGVGAEGTAKSFAAQSGAQPPQHAVRGVLLIAAAGAR
jgi:hypothetical protein